MPTAARGRGARAEGHIGAPTGVAARLAADILPYVDENSARKSELPASPVKPCGEVRACVSSDRQIYSSTFAERWINPLFSVFIYGFIYNLVLLASLDLQFRRGIPPNTTRDRDDHLYTTQYMFQLPRHLIEGSVICKTHDFRVNVVVDVLHRPRAGCDALPLHHYHHISEMYKQHAAIFPSGTNATRKSACELVVLVGTWIEPAVK